MESDLGSGGVPLRRVGWLLLLLVVAPVIAVAMLALVGAASLPPVSAATVPDWALAVARALRDVSAALTVGLLVVAATVLAPEPDGATGVVIGLRRRAVRWASLSGAGWALAGSAVLVLSYADVAGTPITTVGAREIAFFVREFDQGRPLGISALLALIVAFGAARVGRVTSVGLLALTAIIALLPLALAGHSSTASNHAAAVDTLAAHLVGVAVWSGGLAALTLLWAGLGGAAEQAVRRYSRLAGWSFATVAASGIIGAAVRVGSWNRLVTTDYGALLAAKALVLLALAALGLWQRRRVLRGWRTVGLCNGRLFTRLALGEVFLMTVATGLAVALADTSPTSPLDPDPVLDPTTALLGYPMPPALTPLRWVTQWRIDVLWTAVAVLALGWYLLSVRGLRRRGDRWPVGRTTAWVVGWAGFVWATSSGPGAYGPVLFSMHMVQHMTVAMAVPIFLVLGAPVTLALRILPARGDGSRGPREWLLIALQSRFLRIASNPLVAAGVFLGGLVVFYYTPLFELALRTHTGHVLMTLHFLVAGYLFASVVCGVDPGPARPPHLFRLILLVATMGFHAFFGVAMMGSSEILGRSWFASLDRPWGPSLADEQNLGGALAWALGDYPVAIMVLALAVQWIRHDDRESRRYDRQADRDGDAQLAAYNNYLRKLANRVDAWHR